MSAPQQVVVTTAMPIAPMEMGRDDATEQLAKLNDTGLLPIAAVLPLRQAWPEELRWASWGQTQWRFHRAWCVARVTAELPTAIWGVGAARLPTICALCGREAAGLHHLLVRRSGHDAIVAALLAEWAPPPGLAECVLSDTDKSGTPGWQTSLLVPPTGLRRP